MLRTARIRRLAKARPQAKKLYHTGVTPSLAFAVPATGVPPTTMKKWRHLAAAAAAVYHSGYCPTTALALAYSHDQDPAIFFPAQVIQAWLELWRDQPKHRCQAKLCWSKAKASVGKHGWRAVKGPITAVIATLQQAGWQAEGPAQ